MRHINYFMKLGLKTYKYQKGIEYFKNKADFIEVMAIEGEDYSFLKDFSIPVVVHAQHQAFGVNNADKTKYQKNLDSINYAMKIADLTNSKKIIIHSGEMKNITCTRETAISFIKGLRDKRILIENLPNDGTETVKLCTTFEDTKEFLKKTNCGLCFDINHAILTALILNQEYLQIIKHFLKIKPKHYHLGGQKIKEKNSSHRCFSDSEINIREILSLLPKDAEITLETSTDLEKKKKDFKIVRDTIGNM